MVFDLSKKETFKNLEVWLEDTRNFGNKDMIMLIVGNKSDLIDLREVSKDEIDQMTKKYNFNYVEVSALTSENIKICFETVANHIFTQENENIIINNYKYKKKFKNDYTNVKVNKSVELSVRSFLSEKKNNNCC